MKNFVCVACGTRKTEEALSLVYILVNNLPAPCNGVTAIKDAFPVCKSCDFPGRL